MSSFPKTRLHGWKEIASYVARDIRTVERWEKQRGLPVRRVPGAGRSAVYVDVASLEEWLAASSGSAAIAQPEASESSDDGPKISSNAENAVTEASVAEPLLSPENFASVAALRRFAAPRWLAAAAGLFALTAVAVATVRHYRSVAPSANVAAAIRPVHLSSSVPGVDDLCLRGAYLLEQRTPAELKSAQEDFERAAALDPTFAPAFSGLAQTYNLLREYSLMPDDEGYPRAQTAAERAIALAPNLPEPHVSLAFVEFFWRLKPEQAEAEFLTALRLDPNLALAHHWYGSMLTYEGRYREALQELETAQRLEPSSMPILVNRAYALGLSGRRAEAIQLLQVVLKPSNASTSQRSMTAHHVLSSLWLLAPRNTENFLGELQAYAALRDDRAVLDEVKLGHDVYAREGEAAAWRALLAQAEKGTGAKAVYDAAGDEALLGNLDRSAALFQSLARERAPMMSSFSSEPKLDGLHHDPRFVAIRKELGLPEPDN